MSKLPALPEKPFFIVGHPRSGTTLLRYILSSHSRLHIPDETGFIPFLQVDPQTPLTVEKTAALLQRIGQLNRHWAGLVPDVESFYRILPAPYLAYFLDVLYQWQIAPHGAARWGDKTPLYIQYLPQIAMIFPSAQFIHLIRDGRDTALSARQKWPDKRSYMDVYYLLRNWARNVETGRRFGEQVGDGRYIEIQYEKLVHDPEPHIRRLCDFLGESFVDKMLDHTKLAHRIGPDGHTEVLQPIRTGSIGRWRTEMSSFEKKVSNRLAGSLLTRLGYEQPSLAPFTWAETIRWLGLAVKFWSVDGMRRMLYATGLLTLNKGMRK